MYNTIEYKHKINYKIVQLSQGRPTPGSDTQNVKNVFGLSKAYPPPPSPTTHPTDISCHARHLTYTGNTVQFGLCADESIWTI